jgi:hypothetical protein
VLFRSFTLNDSNDIIGKPYKTQTRDSNFDLKKFFDNGFKMDSIVYLTLNEIEVLSLKWREWLRLNKKYKAAIKPFSTCGNSLLFTINDSLMMVNMKEYSLQIFQQGYYERDLGNNWYLYSKKNKPSYKDIQQPKYPYVNLTKFKESKGVYLSDSLFINELREIPSKLNESNKIDFIITPDVVINLIEDSHNTISIGYFCYEYKDCFYLYRNFRIPASTNAQNILLPAENRLNAQEFDVVTDKIPKKTH